MGGILYFNAAVEPAEIVNQLFPNLWVFIAHLIATIVLLLLLTKWVYNPFQKAMQARSQFIQNKISSAIAKETNANMHEKTSMKLLESAQDQAQTIINKAAQEAENKKLYILESARREINNLNEQNTITLSNRRQALDKKIKTSIIENSFLVASEILKTEIEEKRHRELIDDFIKNLE